MQEIIRIESDVEEGGCPLDRLALILLIIGAINWGLVGLFKFDLVASLFGGEFTVLSRIVYTIIGIAGIYAISLLFRDRETAERQQS